MSGIAWLAVIYGAVIVFAIVVVYRTISIVKLPVHLRWELAPVPHEKGKAHYGGSYLEDYEWWTKKRETSFIDSVLYMAKEIFLLKGVWEHNRSLWPFSFSFHTGIYLLVFMVFFLGVAAFFDILGLPYAIIDFCLAVATACAYTGYFIGALGSTGLIIKRAVDTKYKNFNTPSTYFNLIFLAMVFTTGIYSLFASEDFFMEIMFLLGSLLTFDTGVTVYFPLSLHVITALLFVIYLPFTYMIHFIAKYFMYHDVRWNDEPMNPKTEAKLLKLLNQKVTWAGPHVEGGGEKTWIDLANEEMKDDKKPNI